ncbi:MAG: polyprenyl synthetase family protein [Balneola sp.]|nr:polyprenyl synthetase family protein [Balneola sp.]MBO6650695.1 polyprenyl synthetase family protein [Balneola sp.]MBO6710607.1 polyprenyl synthetase family protein [Balneola sp.]MBO6799293.1 polyprenyl synthetase family protein [Balneola sp.]MBO6869578.1 polyprenyl synthetase family protein [Balneola sp.]
MANTDLQKKLYGYIEKGITELKIPGIPESLYAPYSYTMSIGGKRIRPYLVLLSSGICDGRIVDAMPAALAVEILHNFTLVHDDIMDSADTRRGKPSVFKKWDQNTAILSGDVMFADAFKQLEYYGRNDNFSKAAYFQIHKTFTDATITVCEGQALDMDFVHRTDVDHFEYTEMIKGKTSALLACSLKMGAIAALATKEQADSLYNLGMEMGIAFQIQDDLLDVTADPDKFGKTVCGDIYEGKKTYLTILALERSNQQQRQTIETVLADPNPKKKSVEEVLDIMKDLNVISDIQNEVGQHYENAINSLDFFKDSEYKQQLKNLLIFLKNRDH